MKKVFAAVLLIYMFGCSRDAVQEDTQQSVMTVSIAAPVQAPLEQTVSASGWIMPWKEVIISAEANGLKITKINYNVGDTVKKGDILAELDRATVLAELDGFKAGRDKAQAEYDIAKLNADRATKLFAGGALAERAHDEAVFNEKVKAAELDLAKSNLSKAEITLSQTKVGGYDGVISSKSAVLGNVVSSGTELFRVILDGRLEWQAEIASKSIHLIHEGQKAVININGTSVGGTVRSISPSADKTTSRFTVFVDFDSSAGAKAGIYTSGNISVSSYTALTVPESALLLRDGFNYLFIMQPDGRHVSRIRVETGQRKDGYVEITGGLDPDMSVVQSGAAFLSDNATCEVAQ